MSGPSPLLVLGALALVLALIWASRHALSAFPGLFGRLGLDAKRAGSARSGALALEQVVALDARRRLVLARCGARQVVLLTGGAQDLVVGWLDTPPERTPIAPP
jgi:flagellar protein FliO/FliZ